MLTHEATTTIKIMNISYLPTLLPQKVFSSPFVMAPFCLPPGRQLCNLLSVSKNESASSSTLYKWNHILLFGWLPSLSITILRFIYVVVYTSSSFFSTAEVYVLYCMNAPQFVLIWCPMIFFNTAPFRKKKKFYKGQFPLLLPQL